MRLHGTVQAGRFGPWNGYGAVVHANVLPSAGRLISGVFAVCILVRKESIVQNDAPPADAEGAEDGGQLLPSSYSSRASDVISIQRMRGGGGFAVQLGLSL